MPFNVRAYNRDTGDLSEMVRLVQSSWHPQRRPDTNLHVGDLYWRLRYPEYEQALWLWHDDTGQLAGFAEWSPGERTLELQVHPDFARSGLQQEILTWARTIASSLQDSCPLANLCFVYASETDNDFNALLLSNSYLREEFWFNYHMRNLDRDPENCEPSNGFRIRHLHGPTELSARSEGHRAGWQSTLMTDEVYARLMCTDGYRTNLDIVAEAPNGSLAAVCNCWLDEQNKVGLFEPVSTRPDYRRMGLARAIISFGMKQLRSFGANSAWVLSVSSNPGATSLYDSCGFEIVRRDYRYALPADPAVQPAAISEF